MTIEKLNQVLVLAQSGRCKLTKSDKECLFFVLGLVNALADGVAKCTGYPIPEVIRQYGKLVDENEEE